MFLCFKRKIISLAHLDGFAGRISLVAGAFLVRQSVRRVRWIGIFLFVGKQRHRSGMKKYLDDTIFAPKNKTAKRTIIVEDACPAEDRLAVMSLVVSMLQGFYPSVFRILSTRTEAKIQVVMSRWEAWCVQLLRGRQNVCAARLGSEQLLLEGNLWVAWGFVYGGEVCISERQVTCSNLSQSQARPRLQSHEN
jgi:hypothetical protein